MSNEIIEAIKHVIEFVDTKPAAKSCKCAVRRVFHEFEEYMGISNHEFSEDIALNWAEIQSVSHTHGAYYRHNICMLIDYLHEIPLEHNKIYKCTPPPNISSSWSDVLNKYLHEQKAELKASDTIRFSKMACIHFIQYVEGKGCFHPSELTYELCFGVNDAFEFCSTQESKRAYLYKVRMFIRFLQREYNISSSMEYSINTHMRVPYKLVSILTPEQSQSIQEHREADNAKESRAYAITVLARYLGIRTRDICYLKFSDIDWKNNTIRIIQQKTKSEIVLPLIPCVGNALMRYIIKFRPLSKSEYIFVSHKYPHTHLLSRTTMYVASKEIIKYRPEGQSGGLHIMRRTLASDMLRYNVKHEIVSAALGHTCTESIDPYIRIHAESLMKCSLTTEQFGIPEVLR